jgi:hypothetical protein
MTEATGGVEMEEDNSGKIKKFLYVNRKAPYGTIYALESLEVVLIAAAFDQDVSLAFLDDGVYQVVKGQHTKGARGLRHRKTVRGKGIHGGARPEGGRFRRPHEGDQRPGDGRPHAVTRRRIQFLRGP